MRNVLITLLVCLMFFQLSGEQQGGFVKFILQKMDYDKSYFESILKMKKEGKKHPRLGVEEFSSETARASFNLPVLNKYLSQKESYLSGTALTLPPLKEGYRVYINLIALLNMFQSFEKKNYDDVLKYGEYIVVQNKESVGLTTEENSADYYVQLFREYYFLMAASHYHLKDDTKAVEWFAKIEADADLQKLKAQINEEKSQAVDSRLFRLNDLRTKPLAVTDMLNADKNPQNDWMSRGMAEVLTNELARNTDILVVERSQLEKVYKEFELALSGVTMESDAVKIGEVLSAESLLVSSFQKSGEGLLFIFRIIDAKNGQVLESVSGEIAENDEMYKNIRSLVLDLFVKAGWIFPEIASDIETVRAPKLANIRELTDARFAMSTKSQEAKALYEKAVKEDPVLAGIFEDLKAEFKDVSATVAVTPFVNVTGNSDDFWMINALVEIMT
ncbi:MAG TPA: FlgO family outer membrane protein, partial [bacterium]|nr:FlgO family outer membrane protein [bacterium]